MPIAFPGLHRVGRSRNSLQVLPESVSLERHRRGARSRASSMSPTFAFIHVTSSFGEAGQPRRAGLSRRQDPGRLHRRLYFSTVSNYSARLQTPQPAGIFSGGGSFQVWFPFTAKLTVFFPNDGRLNILNAASPISARKTRRLRAHLQELRSRRAVAGYARFQPPWSSPKTRRSSRTSIRKTCR